MGFQNRDVTPQQALDPADQERAFFARHRGLVLGRHLPELDHVERVVPGLRRGPVGDEVGGEIVEADVRLLLLGPMAVGAVLLEDGADGRVHVLRTQSRDEGKGCDEEDGRPANHGR